MLCLGVLVGAPPVGTQLTLVSYYLLKAKVLGTLNLCPYIIHLAMAAYNKPSLVQINEEHELLVTHEQLLQEKENSREKYRYSDRHYTKETIGSKSVKLTDMTSTGSYKSHSERLPPRSCRQFSCSYRFSSIQSKGAVLVLVWNFLVFSSTSAVYSVLLNGIIDHLAFIPNNYAWSLTAASFVHFLIFITYPFAGWFADTHIGRYKAISISMLIIWIGSILMAVCAVVLYWYPDDDALVKTINRGPFIVLLVIISIGIAGFHANVIAFGTDQMQGASSDQLTAFLLWYLWTEYIGFGTVYSYLLAFDIERRTLVLSQTVMAVVCMSVALSLNFLFRNVLEAEPAKGNPLKTIYRVLKYAKKHKTPTNRSSFTYWKDIIPTRLDFAKLCYGGPYTTEQVEDIKTFFRIAAVLLTHIVLANVYVPLNSTTGQFSDHLKGDPSISENSTLLNTFVGATVDYLPYDIILISIPVYLFLVRPVLRIRTPTTLKRVVLGSLIALVSISIILGIEIAGYTSIENKESAMCLFTAGNSSQNTFDIDYRWLFIPNALTGLADVVAAAALLEFVCAQAPYSMKGILLGLFYSQYGLSNAAGFVVLVIFYRRFNSGHPPHDLPLGCGFWYYLTHIVITLFGVVMFISVARWYKPRKRDDVSFEPLYIENYYAQQL